MSSCSTRYVQRTNPVTGDVQYWDAQEQRYLDPVADADLITRLTSDIDDDCRKRNPQCVESQEWTYGIDNTGTRPNDVAEYVFELSDGSTIEFSQAGALATNDWTGQLLEWGANVQSAADNAGLQWFVESRFITATNLTGGGGGLPGAPSEAIGQALYDGGMRWRYLNIQICPGQPVPVRAYRKSSTLFGDDEYELVSAGAVLGPISKFWLCTECGQPPVWYLEDGETEAEAGAIPNCWEPCGTLALAESPPDRACTFEFDLACDNIGQSDPNNFVTGITRRVTFCNGEQVGVDYFEEDPTDPTALITYTLVGEFVDCSTGGVVVPPEPEGVKVDCDGTVVPASGDSVLIGGSKNPIETFGKNCTTCSVGGEASDPVVHTTSGNQTDFTYSYNNNTLKLQGQSPFNDPSAQVAFDAITGCIDDGGSAKIDFVTADGAVGQFTANSIQNNDPTAGLFSGVGDTSLTQSGKVSQMTVVCCPVEEGEELCADRTLGCLDSDILQALNEIEANTSPAQSVQVLAVCDTLDDPDQNNWVPIFVKYTAVAGQPLVIEFFSDVALTTTYTPVGAVRNCDGSEIEEPGTPCPETGFCPEFVVDCESDSPQGVDDCSYSTQNYDPDQGSQWDAISVSSGVMTVTAGPNGTGSFSEHMAGTNPQCDGDLWLGRYGAYDGPPGGGANLLAEGYVLASKENVSGSDYSLGAPGVSSCTAASIESDLVAAGFTAAEASSLVANGYATFDVFNTSGATHINGVFDGGAPTPFGLCITISGDTGSGENATEKSLRTAGCNDDRRDALIEQLIAEQQTTNALLQQIIGTGECPCETEE